MSCDTLSPLLPMECGTVKPIPISKGFFEPEHGGVFDEQWNLIGFAVYTHSTHQIIGYQLFNSTIL